MLWETEQKAQSFQHPSHFLPPTVSPTTSNPATRLLIMIHETTSSMPLSLKCTTYIKVAKHSVCFDKYNGCFLHCCSCLIVFSAHGPLATADLFTVPIVLPLPGLLNNQCILRNAVVALPLYKYHGESLHKPRWERSIVQHGFLDTIERLGNQDQRKTADREKQGAAGRTTLVEVTP